MKVTVFTCFLLSCLPSLAQLEETSAPPVVTDSSLPDTPQEDSRVRIIGELSDGTPPPPPPPKVFPEFKVLRTEVIPLEKRKMILNQVEDPGFPDPTPPTPAAVDPAVLAAFKNSPAFLERQEQQTRTTNLFLSASVVDQRATLLRWWEGGKEYQAWSNLNFKYLTGFTAFRKGERHFMTFMGVGDVDAESVRKHSLFQIPADLPTGKAAFIILQGVAAESEGYEAIAALHELYDTDGERLRVAYELRELRRKEAEEELRANPPVPKDIILNFWKVNPPNDGAEATVPQKGEYKTKGGEK